MFKYINGDVFFMTIEWWETVGISLLSSIGTALLYGAISLYITKSQITSQFELQKKDIQNELEKIKEEKMLEKKMEKAEAIMIALYELYDFMKYNAPLIIKLGQLLEKPKNKEGPVPKEDGDLFWSIVYRLMEGIDYKEFMDSWKADPYYTLLKIDGEMDLVIHHSLDMFDEKRRDMVGALIYFSSDEANRIKKHYGEMSDLVNLKFYNIKEMSSDDFKKLNIEIQAVLENLENTIRDIISKSIYNASS